jgi:glucose/mannose transport system substrate-binding protein
MAEGTKSAGGSLRHPRAALALFLGVAALACDPEQSPVRLEVYSWWEADPERFAFNSVIQLHAEQHPEVEVENLARPTSLDQHEQVAGRVLAGASPSTFQANIGADLLRWTVVDTEADVIPSHSRLEPLTDLFLEQRLFDALPDSLLDALTVAGAGVPYAVPINIHRTNVLYYNELALQRFRDRNQGKSFLDLATLCPNGAAPPELELEIAVGVDQGFTLVLLAFENVLPALTNAAFFREVFAGGAQADWTAEVRRALECVQYLSRHFVERGEDFGWTDAVEEVRQGTAAFTVMGDWANGLLERELALGEVVAVPFPNTGGIYVFTADTFPLPRFAEHREEVLDFLATIASAQAQSGFSALKGSIPARNDADGLRGDWILRRADFLASEQVLATSGYFPPYYPQKTLENKLKAMVRAGAGEAQIAAVIAEMVDAQPLFASWQRRLEEGAAPAL